MKIEYKTVEVSWTDLNSILNEKGNEGWELVQYIDEIAIFKKEQPSTKKVLINEKK